MNEIPKYWRELTPYEYLTKGDKFKKDNRWHDIPSEMYAIWAGEFDMVFIRFKGIGKPRMVRKYRSIDATGD